MVNLKALAEINAERLTRGEAEITVAEMTARLERNRAMAEAAKARHENRMVTDPQYRAKIEAAGKAGAAFGKSFNRG
jgi:UDP:flavonoid glycosyltransferase YjiC (YdhE family)